MDALGELNDDLLLRIFYNLSHQDLCHTTCYVSKQWYSVSSRNELWRFLCFSTYAKKKPKLQATSSDDSEKDSKDRKTSNPDQFLDNNIINLDTHPLFYKNKFFEKAYVKKFHVYRFPQEKVSWRYVNVKATDIRITNEVRQLQYFSIIDAPTKRHVSKKKDTFLSVWDATKEDALELLEYKGLITISERDRRYVVFNLCRVAEDKDALNNYVFSVVKKFMFKTNSVGLRSLMGCSKYY